MAHEDQPDERPCPHCAGRRTVWDPTRPVGAPPLRPCPECETNDANNEDAGNGRYDDDAY